MKKLIVIIILLSSRSLFGQDVYQDFGTWTRIRGIYDLDDFKPYLFVSYRTNNNVQDLESFIIQGGSTYKLNKHWKFGAAVRSIYEPEITGNGKNYWRFLLDAKYSFKIQKVDFTFRNRLQSTYHFLDETKYVERLILKLNKKIIKRVDGFVANEWFLNYTVSENPSFNKFRLYIGLEYKINKRMFLMGRYFRINSIGSYPAEKMNVASVTFEYTLK